MINRGKMVKRERRNFREILNFVSWLTTILVSLAVGFAMAGETLALPWFDSMGLGIITIIAGWVIIISALLWAVLAILNQ